jgi:hypothetical protein
MGKGGANRCMMWFVLPVEFIAEPGGGDEVMS